MIQRAETYVLPITYLQHPASFGTYDNIPVETCYAVVHSSPLAVGRPLLARVQAMQSEAEP